jgi:hypothetical protein
MIFMEKLNKELMEFRKLGSNIKNLGNIKNPFK